MHGGRHGVALLSFSCRNDEEPAWLASIRAMRVCRTLKSPTIVRRGMPIGRHAWRIGPALGMHDRDVGADFNVREGVAVGIDADRRAVIQ
ncbi:hypothetical protein QZN06_13630 [Burkholderia multivorans]|uniref:hypothetical protein n=1 Tax=Burkholderia multivorans TaxID=87883 RepID=UPI0012D97C54|nr:hypothetical protein [Burkholderia multivorans]MDN8009615.1 hypothetical protein [Burkholderia multivorans]HDV6318741.1 hypothetical protein [Burkholderia multivorans]